MSDEMVNATTRLLHAGAGRMTAGAGPINVPVVRTSTVRFENTATFEDHLHRRREGERIATYGRHGLDTHRALEDGMLSLEGGYRAFLTPSGLCAITLVLLALLSAGDHALVADGAYAPLRQIDKVMLARFGIDIEYFSPAHDNLAELIRPRTRVLYLESPTSLLFDVLDLPALSAVARARGIVVAADNTWSGGWFYQPLALGANISIQAATKYISGHSDLMQGVVVADSKALADRILVAYEALGLTVSADDAYLALRGLRTLPVRLAQHQRNAAEVAKFLEQHSQVSRVYYPALSGNPGHALWKRDFSGASGLMSIALRDATPEETNAFIDALALFGIGASWGGYESLAMLTPPERLRDHRQWAGDEPVVRLHVGLEDARDLIADLSKAFSAAQLKR